MFGSSLISVGSSSSQAGEATWRFLVPTRIDPRRRQQLLRWSWEGSKLRQGVEKQHKTEDSRVVTYRKFGDFSSQARSLFPPSKLLVLQAFKAMWTPGCSEPVAVGDNRSRRQLTENSEEPRKSARLTQRIQFSVQASYAVVKGTEAMPFKVLNPTVGSKLSLTLDKAIKFKGEEVPAGTNLLKYKKVRRRVLQRACTRPDSVRRGRCHNHERFWIAGRYLPREVQMDDRAGRGYLGKG